MEHQWQIAESAASWNQSAHAPDFQTRVDNRMFVPGAVNFSAMHQSGGPYFDANEKTDILLNRVTAYEFFLGIYDWLNFIS